MDTYLIPPEMPGQLASKPLRAGVAALTSAGVLLLGASIAGITVIHAWAAPATPSKHTSTPSSDTANPCRTCHAAEVDGFSRSKMAHSMRRGAQEPSGVVRIPGTTITMSSDNRGSWQRLGNQGTTLSYHVDYVVGSGTHASGYLTSLDNHLFQSPVAYYRGRSAYDLAPGYEKLADPDFTRPIERGCLFCHADSFDAKAGTVNEYGKNAIPNLAISCDRCHGPTAAHLANPSRHNIVNPARLAPAARDSVCEQCHLIGVARVLNPGKQFADFHAGSPLEDTFTIYRNELTKGSEFRVISHVEQLALSQCKRESGDKMWCGTCHDPHYEPVDVVSYYRAKCLQCHAGTVLPANHPSKTSDCIGCHMPTRQTTDGGHSVFTDHRIQRKPAPAPVNAAEASPNIVPWREPPIDLAARNQGIASIQVGLQTRSWGQVIGGYQTLAQLDLQFPQDSEMFNTIGAALLAGQKYNEAIKAFELAVKFDPASSPKEANLGQAYFGAGQATEAQQHLQRAIQLDPLNLSAAGLLIELYDRNGQDAMAKELSDHIAGLVQTKPQSK